jgi:carboxylesterase type B
MVSAQMMAYWTHFARTGSPNVPGQSDWPAFNTVDLHTRVINSASTTVNGVRNTIMSIFASAE